MQTLRLFKYGGYTLLLYIALCSFHNHWAVSQEFTPDEPTALLIKPEYRDGLILLTFEPSAEEGVRYRVYRSRTHIGSEADLATASLVGEITEDQIPLEDNPGKDGQYHYAVTVMKDEKEYTNLIPFQNTTLIPVDFSPFPDPIDGFEITPPDNLEAEDLTVDLQFHPVLQNYTYNLYKSSRKLSELSDAEPYKTMTGKEGHFTVSVDESTSYYFIVTTVNRLGVENRSIIPGKNQNAQAFKIERPKTVEKPKEAPVRKITARELIDINLKNNFYRGKYSSALDTFRTILKNKKLTATETATVHFYTGQCYFYLNDYKKAVKYFILSKEVKAFRGWADAWIERCLEKINS